MVYVGRFKVDILKRSMCGGAAVRLLPFLGHKGHQVKSSLVVKSSFFKITATNAFEAVYCE